jgi:hypothetical protein
MSAMAIDFRLGLLWRGFAHWMMKPIPFPAMTFEPLEESPGYEPDGVDGTFVVDRSGDEVRRTGEPSR